MKTKINPIVAIVVVVVLLAGVGFLLYTRSGGGQQSYGADIPPELREAIRQRGPTPMTPAPNVGGAPGGMMAPTGPPPQSGAAPVQQGP